MKQTALFAVLAATLTACVSGPHLEGGRAVELGPIAKQHATRVTVVDVNGTPVTIHSSSALPEETVHAFAHELGAIESERVQQYTQLRDGLRHFLGADLFQRIAGDPQLAAPPLEREWYLLDMANPGALLWRGLGYARYHFLRDRNGKLTVKPPATELQFEIHDLTHRLNARLAAPAGQPLPRWLDEGVAQYVELHYARWIGRPWDGNREILARLAWDREPLAAKMFERWRSGGLLHGLVRTATEDTWQSDLLYSTSLGLVLAIDRDAPQEQRVVKLMLDLYRSTPTDDATTVARLEAFVGARLRSIGRLSAETRKTLFAALTMQAREIEQSSDPEIDTRPIVALGHFPEQRRAVIALYEALAKHRSPQIRAAVLRGSLLLGDPVAVKRLNGLVGDSDDRYFTSQRRSVEEFLGKGHRVRRWFEPLK